LPAIDWGEATRIAGAGLGMVGAVLILLALATWLAGVLLQRVAARAEAKSSERKAEP